jgi:hypothetical protein
LIRISDLQSALLGLPKGQRRLRILTRQPIYFGLGDQPQVQAAPLTPVEKVKAFLRGKSGGGRLVQRPFDDRISIRSGEGGTEDTINEMARQAVLGSRDLIVRLMARDILEGIPGRDHDAIARRFFYWMQDRGSGERSGVKFVNDPWRTEQVRAPWFSLTVSGDGDCNSSFATSLAALLMSVGVPAFFRTVAADPGRKGDYSHVYTVAVIRGKELSLDASVPFSKPGSEPSVVYKVKNWPISLTIEDDWGVMKGAAA